MQTKVKSPLRYPGGKSRALKHILPIIPKFDEFREPFLGGGSVFVALKQKYPNKKYWINDLHLNLFRFWKSCQNNTDELISIIKNWYKNFEDGNLLHKYLIQNIDEFSDVEKGGAFFVLNRITFSGTSESGGYSSHAFKGRFTESSIERVTDLSKILNNVLITNEDYSKLLCEHGDNVFIFLDPPYYSASKSALYGKNGKLHKQFDHERFANEMKHCKHKWLITYDDSDYIRNLFSFAHIRKWNLLYGMKNVSAKTDNIGNELFISNYPINSSFNPREAWEMPTLF